MAPRNSHCMRVENEEARCDRAMSIEVIVNGFNVCKLNDWPYSGKFLYKNSHFHRNLCQVCQVCDTPVSHT